VLYVAIGRRIGYPMHLVSAKEHLFARWDDGKGTRVNLEAANAGGFTSHPDSYYRTWPKPISPEEEKAGGYLRNLNTAESLAVFLTTRAACLQARGASFPAINSAAAAYRLAPNLGGIQFALNSTLIDSAGHEIMKAPLMDMNYNEIMAYNRSRREDMEVNPHNPNPSSPSTYFKTNHPQPGFPNPLGLPQPHQATYPNAYHGYQHPHSHR
jgi:hypothetical protein